MSSDDFWGSENQKHTSGQRFTEVRDFRFKDNAKHHLRILPNKDKGKPPAHGYIIHWIPQVNSKKGRPIIHPIDKRCAVCDYVSEIWGEINRMKEENNMTENSPEIKELMQKQGGVKGKKMYDMNIIDRDEPFNKDGKIAPKRLGATSTIWKPIFDYASNPKWGSPSNIENGYDFEIETEGEKERREYSVVPDRTSSPLTPAEVEAIELCYDLEKLRKSTSSEDMADILEHAKPPYHDIIDLLKNDDEPKKQRTEEKPVKESTKEKEPVREEPKSEPVKETKKEVVKEEPKEIEEPEETPVQEATGNDDENDLNCYECKGDFDKNATECKDCPVQKSCTEFQPYFIKAKELKIDVSADKKVDDIVASVKATEKPTEKPAEAPKRGKAKRDLPF